uniref:Uncharacterized protein n=1 Tax=Rousettus aegyptiacus TaxID=9407 RepID=A0A7J8HQW8_ROUAE|nr:hypothetical protein HJG63_010913 [Rousettus aegyptiacus]
MSADSGHSDYLLVKRILLAGQDERREYPQYTGTCFYQLPRLYCVHLVLKMWSCCHLKLAMVANFIPWIFAKAINQRFGLFSLFISLSCSCSLSLSLFISLSLAFLPSFSFLPSFLPSFILLLFPLPSFLCFFYLLSYFYAIIKIYLFFINTVVDRHLLTHL